MSACYGCPDTGATDRGSAECLQEDVALSGTCSLYRIGTSSSMLTAPQAAQLTDRTEVVEKLGIIQEQVLTVTRELVAFRGEVAQIKALTQEASSADVSPDSARSPGCRATAPVSGTGPQAATGSLAQLQRWAGELQGSLRSYQGTCDTRYASMLQRMSNVESATAAANAGGAPGEEGRCASLSKRVDALSDAVAGFALAPAGSAASLQGGAVPEAFEVLLEERLEAFHKSLAEVTDTQSKQAAETRNRLDEMYGLLDEHHSEILRLSQDPTSKHTSPRGASTSTLAASGGGQERLLFRVSQLELRLSSVADKTTAECRASQERVEQLQRGFAEHQAIAQDVQADRASLQKCVRELESVLRRPLGGATGEDALATRAAPQGAQSVPQGGALPSAAQSAAQFGFALDGGFALAPGSAREASLPFILRRLDAVEGGLVDLRTRLGPRECRSKTPPAGMVFHPSSVVPVAPASLVAPAAQPRSPPRLVISPRQQVSFSSPQPQRPGAGASPGPVRPAGSGAGMGQSPPLAQPRLPATLRGRPGGTIGCLSGVTLGAPVQPRLSG